MVTEVKKEEKVKIIHESVFWDEDDPRWRLMGKIPDCRGETANDLSQVIDMLHDAYIWAFTGPRGAGKSIAMTYYAGKAVYLYNMRLVSNYPISFVLKIGNSSKYVESEPLDLYKLLCFDEDYQHCLILIDESPDIISHMASMTWKNRLLNIFVRQLRKNMNSLFLGTQQLGLVDKSMRWQTDVVVKCKDAFRIYGASGGLERGACVFLDLYDNSGQWTGDAINADWDAQLNMVEPTDSLELPGRIVWGAFDTFYKQDIFESLKKVDMQMSAYHVGDKEEADYSDCIRRALPVVEAIFNDGKKVESTELYKTIGEMTSKEKLFLGKAFNQCGMITSKSGKFKDFTNFNYETFEGLAK